MAVTITEETFNRIKKVKFDWTSIADGTASGTTVNAYTGEIIRLVTIPSGGGTAPTTLYDINILDEDSTNILMGAGVDRSATVTEQVLASSLGCVANDKLTLYITNSGDSKAGTTIIYIK